MAQLKDSIVSGNLRVTDEILTDTAQARALRLPSTSGGSTYTAGTSGQFPMSDGTNTYWSGLATSNNVNYTNSNGSLTINSYAIRRVNMNTTSSSSTAFLVETDSSDPLTSLYDGLTIVCKNTKVASAANCTLQVNNTGAKRIWLSQSNSYCTTHWALNQTYIFIYDETNDRWELQQGRDTDSDMNAMHLRYYNNVKAKEALTAEKIIVGSADGYEVAASGITFDITYPILWTNVAVAKGSSNYANMYEQVYDRNLGNVKSGFSSAANKAIYLVTTISGKTGTVDATIITDTLPTTDDGKVYIYLGKLGNQSTGANYFIFEPRHPMVWYKNGRISPYADYAINAGTVNNHTVNTDVPSGALFTDTQANWNQTTTTALDFIKNKPTLGTASAKDVPSSGNASTTQVVMGNDTRLTDSRTPSSHTHGNIQNGGTLQTTDITIASGDKLVVTDASDSNKVARTSVSFDGSTATKCLTQKGTFESFTNNADTIPSAYCDTAAATQAKTALCTDFTLTANTFVHIIIKNANTYNGTITLNINSTGVKPIYINNAISSSSNKTLPAGTYIVYFNGTNYYFKTDGTIPHIGSVGETTRCVVDGGYAHAEGEATSAYGNYSHTEGSHTFAKSFSHAEGSYTSAISDYSHTEGSSSITVASYAHAEGHSTTAAGECAHAEGSYTYTSGTMGNHVEGNMSTATGYVSHAEGLQTCASGTNGVHAEGENTRAKGSHGAHAEGYKTTAYSDYGNHAEGHSTSAAGPNGAHAEGYCTTAKGGNGAHAEGYYTYVNGPNGAHAEGYCTTANGSASHAEGYDTLATGAYSHTEGSGTVGTSEDSHAEGYYTTATGDHSHAEGTHTCAAGANSHAEGNHTIASGENSHVEGAYNVEDLNNEYVHIIGGGINGDRKNIFTVNWTGDVCANSFGPLIHNAITHRNVYRGKNLGNTVTTAQYNAINAGTFEDIYIGDYWEITEPSSTAPFGGRTMRFYVADFDTFYNIGKNTQTTKHHILIIPNKRIPKDPITVLSPESCNGTTDANSGYFNSAFRQQMSTVNTYLFNLFGEDHILKHEEFIQSSKFASTYSYNYLSDTAMSVANCTAELLNQQSIFGGNVALDFSSGIRIYENTGALSNQLPIFRYMRLKDILVREYVNGNANSDYTILRDNINNYWPGYNIQTGVCFIKNSGNCGFHPYFLLCKSNT